MAAGFPVDLAMIQTTTEIASIKAKHQDVAHSKKYIVGTRFLHNVLQIEAKALSSYCTLPFQLSSVAKIAANCYWRR